MLFKKSCLSKSNCLLKNQLMLRNTTTRFWKETNKWLKHVWEVEVGSEYIIDLNQKIYKFSLTKKEREIFFENSYRITKRGDEEDEKKVILWKFTTFYFHFPFAAFVNGNEKEKKCFSSVLLMTISFITPIYHCRHIPNTE